MSWKNYHTATSLQEALELLNQYGERARIIAGGTDIMLELEHHKRPQVDTLIDITRVPNLDHIELENGMITLGCLVNHNHVSVSDTIRQYANILAQASWEVGAPQIRNRATVAGNVITASPANDTIVPLFALNASITLASVDGEREVPIREFYTGLRKNVMQSNELLTKITFPAMQPNQRAMFLKLGLRRAQAISVVNTAILLTFDESHKITDASLALGSVAPTIITIQEAEQALIGEDLTPELISKVANLTATIPTPIDDVRSTAEYRIEMIKVLVARALRHILTNTTDTVPTNPAMLWGDSQVQVPADLKLDSAQHDPNTLIETTINGEVVRTTTGADKSMLRWLREDAHLNGTKEGCAEGECGACTVFLDGVAVMSCMVPAPRAHHADIVTVEGLETDNNLHSIQTAFIDQGAVQCGYCTPGFIMSGAKLLDEHPEPTLEQIQQSISGNLCRCTGYYKIIDAFQQASQSLEKQE